MSDDKAKLGKDMSKHFPWALSEWEIIERQVEKGDKSYGRLLARKKVAGGYLYREEMWHEIPGQRSLALAFVPEEEEKC